MMDIARGVWDMVRLLLGVGVTGERQTGTRVAIKGLPGEGKGAESYCAPGHYGVMRSGRPVVFMRRDNGAIVVATLTAPPADAADGEAGIVTDEGGIFRLRGKLLEALGFEAIGGIVLGSDRPPILPVARSGDTVTIGGYTVGTIQTTGVHVQAGT